MTSEAATEFAVSPDGRWVAFRERFNAYVAPFVPTGKPIEIGPKMSRRCRSRGCRSDAGEYLHWSGDSQAAPLVAWARSSSRRDLSDAFAFVAGAPEKLPEAAGDGSRHRLRGDADVPNGDRRPRRRPRRHHARRRGDRGRHGRRRGQPHSRRRTAASVRGARRRPRRRRHAGKTSSRDSIDVHWHGAHGRGPDRCRSRTG